MGTIGARSSWVTAVVVTMMVVVAAAAVVVSMVPLERVSSFISHRRSGPPIQRDVLMAEPCWN